jgi:fluoride exporter
MSPFVWVASGGALGSAARYGLGLAALRFLGGGFPWATLGVNVLGGLAMGVLTARVGVQHESLRFVLGVGVLGGFTTFSAFSLETVRLLAQQPGHAILYVLASVVLSVSACGAGLVLGRV